MKKDMPALIVIKFMVEQLASKLTWNFNMKIYQIWSVKVVNIQQKTPEKWKHMSTDYMKLKNIQNALIVITGQVLSKQN